MSGFLTKPLRLSLRLKLTFLIEAIVIAVIVITGFITTIREKETLEKELQKRGLALASDLAGFMARPLLGHDLPTLRRFVNQAMEQEYVRYAIVLGPKGEVVMHNELSEVGKVYRDALSTKAVRSKGPGCTDIRAGTGEEPYCDMFSPVKISDVRLGTIRLGYSHQAIRAEIGWARRQVVIVGLLTAIGSGFMIYLLAVYISSPIKRITEATGRVARGHLDTHLSISRNDEIGALAGAFNTMTEDLQRTTVSKNYFDNIIRSMSDTLVVIGPDSRIKSANKAALELLEYEEGELLGKPLSVILPDLAEIGGGILFGNLERTSFIVNREACYATRTGGRVPMLLSAAVMDDETGNIEGAVCIAKNVTELKKAEDALRESERELHFLSAQLMTAHEKERRRLSAELHDELGQSLMVLRLKMRSIQQALPEDRRELREECDEGIDYINQVVENVRRLSRDLSPAVLENLGLCAAVRWLVDAFGKHTKIDCTLDMGEIGGLFSQEEEITIYRMIQESLTNIAKHADATRAFIEIAKKRTEVLFTVEDNGKGFDPRNAAAREPGKRGLGLSAMLERTRMLGGTMNIRSKEGAGTRISFSVPCLKKEGPS